MKRYTWKEIETLIVQAWGGKPVLKVWGVPRGGIHVAQILEKYSLAEMVDELQDCELVVDDLIDSGRTKDKYKDLGFNFWCPIEKSDTDWIEFPWEQEMDIDHEDIITRYIEAIGDDPKRAGVLETPKRVVKSWKEIYGGYKENAGTHLSKCFDSDSDEMVICKDIEFYSTCEHHMIPIMGKAHIAYIPDGKVVGLSKLARTVEVYARRLQIQEQLTCQIADALEEHIPNIKGCAVVIEAKHFCMCSRGANKQNSSMVTSALKGCFRETDVRTEFFNLIR